MASNPEDDFLQYEPAPEGAYRELGIGALQGATTDLGGGIVDIGALTTGLASKVDPRLLAMSPTASALAAADPAMQGVAAEYGSEALGSRFFPAVPEGLEGYRDLGRLAGGVTGAGEAITARGSRALLGGIQDYMRYLPNVRPQAVTPDGQIIPLPDDGLPDTSVTEMLASADTPGINPKYAKDLKKAENIAAKRLEEGEDPRKVFEETGFMRINVDARPGREAGDAPLETKMVFDIPDNLTQINVGGLLPESVASKVSAGKSGKEVMDAFKKLNDPKNYFVEEFHRGGKYGRSVKFKLKDVMGEDHPLFDVFPDLGDEIDFRIVEKLPKGSGGHWDDSTNTIAIKADYLGDDRYTSTLLVHELAHVLQTRGDLPGGSSPFLVKESVSGNFWNSFMLDQSTDALAEPNNKSFKPFEFFHELRSKADAKVLENLVSQARFNVKNADPAAPDNLSRMWPGNLNSTAPINLDEMPYRDEVLAEMRRLIKEKEEKAFKAVEAYQALGIDIFRATDPETGSLRLGPSAQGNYMRTRGEFMARLQEAYALATEGMPVGERRKLFPMDIPRGGARPTADAPGGNRGIAGTSLEEFKRVRPGSGDMVGTELKSYDTEGAERGLVDVEGLINVDKIPEDLKKKIERPSGPAAAAEESTALLGGDKPQRFYHGTNAAYKEFDPDAPYTFVADEPSTAEYYAGDALDGAPNIRPVYLKDVNFFDVDNPEHLQQLLDSDWYAQYGKSLDDAFFDYSEDMNFLDLVEAGDYGTIEDSGLIDWIKSQGFDGFTTYEQDGKNYGVFNVENIVPGVAKKKEGGIVSMVDVARSTGRGPKGVASLAPKARNMFRPMVS